MRRRIFLALAPLLLALAVAPQGCTTQPPGATIARFDEARLREIDVTITNAIADRRTPGAVLWIERDGSNYHRAYGLRALDPVEEPMTGETVFDAASLTKVVATTPSVMILLERGELDLDKPVHHYIDEFRRDGKDAITVRHLMTHVSGLRSGLSQRPDGQASAIQIACQEKLVHPVGTKFLYSDINFILLGEIVHRVSHIPLEKFAQDNVFAPLKMHDTRYVPPQSLRPRIAPTERAGTGHLRGVVHDPTARNMGGVAGHAGLFTTAADLARFARMMLNQGELDGARILRPETVRFMTSVQTAPTVEGRRGLGWDIDTAYSGPRGNVFPIGSYGHTGFTGTSLWIDPFSKTFVILLCNSVHIPGRGDIRALRRNVGTLAAQAVTGFDFTRVSGALAPRATNNVGTAR
jgi:CubicO group peptidase (beta-lactamase class C family)